jgi:uncharacterized protein YjiS (DUF1127 family)
MLTIMLDYLARKWKESKVYAKTANELCKLSNRDLADIGVNRCDIEFIAREHAKNAHLIKTA